MTSVMYGFGLPSSHQKYIYYHPGGAEHLMRGAGRDCTDLFDEYHAWVSAEAYMAIGQRVGMKFTSLCLTSKAG